jgi:hypothetical protein
MTRPKPVQLYLSSALQLAVRYRSVAAASQEMRTRYFAGTQGAIISLPLCFLISVQECSMSSGGGQAIIPGDGSNSIWCHGRYCCTVKSYKALSPGKPHGICMYVPTSLLLRMLQRQLLHGRWSCFSSSLPILNLIEIPCGGFCQSLVGRRCSGVWTI